MGRAIPIEHLSDEVGAQLLLRVATKGAPKTDREPLVDQVVSGEFIFNSAEFADAQKVSAALGGLALALDHAGAFMHKRGVTAAKYLELYNEHGGKVLERGEKRDHDTVACTYSMALEQVEAIDKYGPAAAQLIRLCAFLAPDAIPDRVLRNEHDEIEAPLSQSVSDDLEWLEVVEAATRYSLIKRDDAGESFSLHRLVAEVVRESLSYEERRTMLKAAVNAVAVTFPEAVYGNWEECARILPHALALVRPIKDSEIVTRQAALLLSRAAWYFQVRARYAEAEPLMRANLAMRRRLHGDLHEGVATSLNNLCHLLEQMGQLTEAVRFVEEAISIVEQLPDTPAEHLAIVLDRLAMIYYRQKRFASAEPIGRRALELTEAALGLEHPQVSIRLNNHCLVLQALNKFDEAEPLRLRDLAIREKTQRRQQPGYATSLLNLGALYVQWRRLERAKGPLCEASELHDLIYQGEHPDCAHPSFWLARWHYERDELRDARDFFQQALEIRQRFLAPDHPDTEHTREWIERVTREMAGRADMKP